MVNFSNQIETVISEWLDCVAERTLYFCLARKLIWPLWAMHIFTQWGWHPIQPGPAPNWGRAAKHFLPQNLSKRTDVLTVRSLHSSSITTPWGKSSNLWTSWVYSLRLRVPGWIWIRCIQSATHRNTFKSPPTLAMSTAMQNSAQTSSYFIPGQHFLETCFSPTTTRTTHSWVTTSFLSLTSKHDLCYT